jgi:hypothetical protein
MKREDPRTLVFQLGGRIECVRPPCERPPRLAACPQSSLNRRSAMVVSPEAAQSSLLNPQIAGERHWNFLPRNPPAEITRTRVKCVRLEDIQQGQRL